VTLVLCSSNELIMLNQGAVARAVRETPWESRFEILKRRIKPRYMKECPGTPRRELQDGVIDGIRVKPTFNPYVQLNRARRYRLDRWASRNWDDWNPRCCFIRGSRHKYNVPDDLLPYKDDLGEWHPPRVSGRYQADIEKQYYMNGLPWVWKKDFYTSKSHTLDREPLAPKKFYSKELRNERVKEAMKNMDNLVMEYRKQVREKRRYSWWERMVYGMAGEDLATNYIRKRNAFKSSG